MKFNKSSQLLLVGAASLLAALFIAACGTDTVDFVFVASSLAAGPNNYGEIDVFEINSVSGYMRQIPTSPFPSGGRQPVAEAVSPDDTNLYVVNENDNAIVQFLIGSDGKLYPQNTVNTPGVYPMAVAVNGSNLFVLDTYQGSANPPCSKIAPCSGSVSVFPLLTTAQAQALTPPEIADTLGPPVANPGNGADYWPLTLTGAKSSDIIVPTAVNILHSGSYVYVAAYDSSVTPNAGYLFGFTVGTGGALTPLNGGVPFAAGVHPSAIASDSTSSYVYVTDSTSGKVHGYSVSSGVLNELSGSPFPAGNQPSAIVVDSNYAYVANAVDGNVEAYSISSSSGALSFLGGSATPVTYAAGIQPVAIGIDPGINRFLFTVNFTPDGSSGTVSDFQMSATDGTLINTQSSPYMANALPTAVAAVPHNSPQK